MSNKDRNDRDPGHFDAEVEAEKRKISELFREIKSKGDQDDDKLNWMYKNPTEVVDREEYLLGRSVDKALDSMTGKGASSSNTELANFPKRVLSAENRSQTEQVDLQKKMHEDPLFAIRQKEMAARKQLLNNPLKVKELKKMLEAEAKKKKKIEKLARKAERKKKREEKVNFALVKALRKLSGKVDIQSMLDSSSDNSTESEEEKEKTKKKKRASDSSDDESEEEKGRSRSKRRARSSDREHKVAVRRKTDKFGRTVEMRQRKVDSHQKESRRMGKRGRRRKESSSDSDSPDRDVKHSKSSRAKERSENGRKAKKQIESKRRKPKHPPSSSSSESSDDERAKRSKVKRASKKKQRQESSSSSESESESESSSEDSTDVEERKKYHAEKRREEKVETLNKKKEDHSKSKKTRRDDSGSDRDGKKRNRHGSDHQVTERRSSKTETKSKRSSHHSPDSQDEGHSKRKKYGLSTLDGSKPDITEKPILPYKKKEEVKPAMVSKKPVRLSEAEKEAQLKEMMDNAKWRKKAREVEYTNHKKAKSREDKIDDYDESFLKNQLSRMTSRGSMADRIKSNINNIQRSESSMHTSFVRK